MVDRSLRSLAIQPIPLHRSLGKQAKPTPSTALLATRPEIVRMTRRFLMPAPRYWLTSVQTTPTRLSQGCVAAAYQTWTVTGMEHWIVWMAAQLILTKQPQV